MLLKAKKTQLGGRGEENGGKKTSTTLMEQNRLAGECLYSGWKDASVSLVL